MKYLKILTASIVKHRASLSTLLIFAIIAAEYSLIIRPSDIAMLSLTQECEQIKTQIASNEISNRNIDASSEKFKKADEIISRLQETLIDKNREIEFVTHLEKLANDHRIIQQPALGPLKEDKSKNYQVATLDINAQGKYQDLMRYLSALEKMEYASNITSLSLSQGDDAGDSSMHLIINTYWK